MNVCRVSYVACAGILGAVALSAAVVPDATAAGGNIASTGTTTADASSPVEDIYVLRSSRQSRLTTPGAFCDGAKIGFPAQIEDQYSFKAVATRASDGKVVDASQHDAGTLHACFDSVPGIADTNFYAEGVIAGITATGKGKCTIVASEFPEPGITSFRCFLVLSSLSAPYFAGVLTTNTIRSREPLGDRSDPPGYIQPSIATIRVWRKR
jgi:hypothetical protein